MCAAVMAVREALHGIAQANPVFLSTGEKAALLTEVLAAEAELTELRLRVMAVAGDVAEEHGARDVGSWLARAGREDAGQMRRDASFADALAERSALVAEALRAGAVTVSQARVIARVLDRLPADLDQEACRKAEKVMVEYAAQFGPQQLWRLGRRILEVVAPEIAEAELERQLRDEERSAWEKTSLSVRSQGDGTTRLSARIPDALAARLSSYLHGFTNPRLAEQLHQRCKEAALASAAAAEDAGRAVEEARAAVMGPCDRHCRGGKSHTHRLGLAFAQLLETWDPSRLPVHGGDATTMVVTLDFETLAKGVGEATVVGDLPGEPTQVITAEQARRLACKANLVPAVLGGASEVLDLGRAQRLFSRAQRRALLLRDRTCRAEGCDIPGAWSEAHHWLAWAEGGATDLDNAVLLCSTHHHRVHDPRYEAERLPNGDVRFHRRR